MRVLVTGGAGYLGIAACQVLASAGHAVRSLDVRRPPRSVAAAASIEWVEGSITCLPDVRRAVAACDAVVHLAGLSSDAACRAQPRLARRVNLDAALVLARVAQTQGCHRFVHASSASVYGNRDTLPQPEAATPQPLSLYARFKLDLEERLNAMVPEGLEPVHLRQATLFGWSPSLRADLAVNAMTREAVAGRPIVVRGGGQQWRPFLHVRDAARCLLAAVEAPAAAIVGEVFNVGSDAANLRIRDVAAIVQEVYPGTAIVILADPPDGRSYRLACGKVEARLGWRAEIGVAAGVRELGAALGGNEEVGECVSWRSVR